MMAPVETIRLTFLMTTVMSSVIVVYLPLNRLITLYLTLDAFSNVTVSVNCTVYRARKPVCLLSCSEKMAEIRFTW